jgi:hypothetical protein
MASRGVNQMTKQVLFRFVILTLALPLVAACGGRPMGEVSGTVTLDGQPLALGTITFFSQDGTVWRSNVLDGAYRVAKVPVGPVKITVFAHPSPIPAVMLDQIQPPPPPAYRKPYVPIPDRYQDPDKSGLTYTVTRGTQTHDVALTP